MVMGAIRAFRRWILPLACWLVALLTQPAFAYSVEGPTWQNGTTAFNSFLSNGPLTFSTDIALSIVAWNQVSAFKFVDTGNSADPCNDNGPNGAAFGTNDCGSAFGSGVLAVTTYTNTGRKSFIHAGIVFNSNVAFSSYDGPMRGNVDFKRVALHELGHVLGMDHEMDPTIPAIMAPNVSDIYQLQADDIAGAQFLYGAPTAAQTTIVSAVLPASRSVQVNATATAFATIVNAGPQAATGCSIALGTPIAANLYYQTTSAATNQPTGSQNVPVTIAGNASQSFVIGVTPNAPFNPTNVGFTMQCANAAAATTTVGLNTLLLSASTTPVPDVIALAATAQSDGYVHVGSGQGAFAVATSNVGATADIVASADTGSTVLPVTVGLCQTNPTTGQCITPIGPSVMTNIAANTTPTFAIFLTATASVAPDPANKRIFVRFRGSTDGLTRGATSVAVTSRP